MGVRLRRGLARLGLGALLSGVLLPIPRLEPITSDAVAPVEMEVRVVPRAGRVALTFDDGPHPEWTLVVLDVLDRYGVKATFFVNGFRVDRHPDLVAEIVRRGHSVQNHGYGHRRLTDATDAGVRWDVEHGAASIATATGVRPVCLRPPWGATSGRVQHIVSSLGQEVVTWTLDSQDYANLSGPASAVRVLDRLQPGDVVLMHDTIGWAAQVALPMIIEGARARGLDFDTICEHNGPVLGVGGISFWRDGRSGPG